MLVKGFVYNLTSESFLSRNSSDNNFRSSGSSSSGVQIPFLYHTSIVVFNKEYTFTWNKGISVEELEQTEDPELKEKLVLGTTEREETDLQKYLEEMERNGWVKTNYDYVKRNCLHFCKNLISFLGVSGFPKYVEEVTEAAEKLFQSQEGVEIAAGAALLGLAGVGIAAGLSWLFSGSKPKPNSNNKQ